MSSCSVYGEYGVGLSTITAFREYGCDIIGVDTSQEWIEDLTAGGVQLEHARVRIDWVDLGPVGAWGRPISYEKAEYFSEYTGSIWKYEQLPDLVLIDGRFRVACFLDCLMRGKPGTYLLFDDYVERPPYHVVEEVVAPLQKTTRQALFKIPRALDFIAIHRMYERFLMVMD